MILNQERVTGFKTDEMDEVGSVSVDDENEVTKSEAICLFVNSRQAR